MLKSKYIKKITEILEEKYYGAYCALNFKSPFELLIATILSAQCTDKQVNKITGRLFKLYNTPEQFASLEPAELEPHIKSAGVYRNKALAIVMASRRLVEHYGSRVPNDLKELMTLRGVGRKTANVVISNAFGGDAIAVDTHVFRVSNRIGLADAKTPYDTEMQLMEALPQQSWSRFHHYLIWHGRNVCKAQRPLCDICEISTWCEYYNNEVKGK
jgi:endonuclease-3